MFVIKKIVSFVEEEIESFSLGDDDGDDDDGDDDDESLEKDFE